MHKIDKLLLEMKTEAPRLVSYIDSQGVPVQVDLFSFITDYLTNVDEVFPISHESIPQLITQLESFPRGSEGLIRLVIDDLNEKIKTFYT